MLSVIIIVSLCTSCKYEQENVVYEETTTEINKKDEVPIQQISTSVEDYIIQHKNYIQKGQFKEDIVPGFPQNMKEVLKDKESDKKADEYIIWTGFIDVLQLDYEKLGKDFSLDARAEYSLLLTEILFIQNQENLEELVVENVANTTITIVDTIANIIQGYDDIEDSVYSKAKVDRIFSLIDQMKDADPWSSEFNDYFTEVSNLIEESTEKLNVKDIIHETDVKLEKELGEKSFIVGLGIDIASTVSEDIISYINYCRYGEAYLNTNDAIKKVLAGATIVSSDYVEFSEQQFMFNALKDYIFSMEDYRYEQAKSFASRMTGLYADIVADTGEKTVEDVATAGLECLLFSVPYLGPVLATMKGAKDVSVLLHTAYEMRSKTDDRYLQGKMAYDCDLLAEIFYEVADYFSVELMDDDPNDMNKQYEHAVYFDAAIKMYKATCINGAKYTVKYEELLTETNNVDKERCNDNIRNVEKEIETVKAIKCHGFPSEVNIGEIKPEKDPYYYLTEYYNYLNNNEWIFQYEGNDELKKMCVFDLNNDGILEVGFRYSGTTWGNETCGVLSYSDGLQIDINNGLENESYLGTYIYYVNENNGTFITVRTRGKAVEWLGKLDSSGKLVDIDSFATCYYPEGEWNEQRIDEYNLIISNMKEVVWVPINKENLDYYLKGEGKKTGVSDEVPPYLAKQYSMWASMTTWSVSNGELEFSGKDDYSKPAITGTYTISNNCVYESGGPGGVDMEKITLDEILSYTDDEHKEWYESDDDCYITITVTNGEVTKISIIS